jgi:site-specific recombinase XerD
VIKHWKRGRIGAVVNLKGSRITSRPENDRCSASKKGDKEKEIPAFFGCNMNTVANNARKRQNLNFYKLLTPSEILQVFMGRFDGANLLKRRLRDAGIIGKYSPHSFRATGITNYLENGGTLEVTQRIAGHADSRTTKLYDRRGQKVLLEDMERIRYCSQISQREY